MKLINFALAFVLAIVNLPAVAAQLGPEHVIDGGFSTPDPWTLGYSWQINPGEQGSAFHNEGYTAPISQAITTLQAGVTYRITYVISGTTGSTMPGHVFRLVGDTTIQGGWAIGPGTFTFDLPAPANPTGFKIVPSSGFGGVLDNVSIRELLP